MSSSIFTLSLENLLQALKQFNQQASDYLKNYCPASSSQIKQCMTLWLHHEGIINLIKNLSHQFQIKVPKHLCCQLKQKSKIMEQFMCQNSNGSEQPKLTTQRLPTEVHLKEIQDQLEVAPDQIDQLFYVNQKNHAQQQEQNYKPPQTQLKTNQQKRGHYKRYSLVQKLEATNLYQQEITSLKQLSKRLRIPCRNIKRWALETTVKNKRGRREANPHFQQQLYQVLRSKYSDGETIRIHSIQSYALGLSSSVKFKASYGWAKMFVERFQLKKYYEIT